MGRAGPEGRGDWEALGCSRSSRMCAGCVTSTPGVHGPIPSAGHLSHLLSQPSPLCSLRCPHGSQTHSHLRAFVSLPPGVHMLPHPLHVLTERSPLGEVFLTTLFNAVALPPALPLPFSYLISLHSTCHHLSYIFTYFVYCSLLPLESKLHEGKDFCFVCVFTVDYK